MNKLKKVYELTLRLKELLNQDTSSSEREEVILQLDALIKERGKWMDGMPAPLSNDEKVLAAEIYSINKDVQEKMEQIFTELKVEMRQIQKQKKSKQFYTNPYKDVQVSDGTFLDSKK